MRSKRVACVVSVMAAASVLGPSEVARGQVIAESHFDRGAEGWGLLVSTAWSATQGNGGGCLLGSVDEPSNTTSFAFASPAFLGSWTALDGVAQLRYDYRRLFNGGGTVLAFIPLTVIIKGGAGPTTGKATWTGATITAPSPWITVNVPIERSAWTVNTGTWEEILSNVTEVAIELELVSSTGEPDDKNVIDNVVLEFVCTGLGDLDNDCDVDAADLAILLGAWGASGSPADLDGDGTVAAADLALLLGAWTG